ncbi:MAG: Mur ligase [Gemmatimonadetes bacterium]|nr:Mur ligase [Gemmatimonadota bacterium]
MTHVHDGRASEFASPAIVDSRRLMGPNRFGDDPGAVIDVEVTADERALLDSFLAAWRDEALALAAVLKWAVQPAWRRSATGASCFIKAPVDALMSATELNERAWARGEARVRAAHGGPAVHDAPSVLDAANAIGVLAEGERVPHLAALVREARLRGITVLIDNDTVSVGTGETARTWPLAQAPDPDTVAWMLHDRIPIALVTGSNGKTTTVRMLAAILREAVGSVAVSSTTGVYVDGVLVDAGDYSGPAGARLALREPRARAAVLETARGGILRRGLAMYEADVAVVTNVAADHFGDYGIHDVASLAEVKLTVARVVRSNGTLVLNAEDAALRQLGPATGARIVWCSLDPDHPLVRVAALATADVLASQALAEAAAAEVPAPSEGQLWRAAEAWTIVGGWLVRRSAAGDEPVVAVAELPSALNGAARFNVANALAAAASASALGVPMTIVADALRAFGRRADDNPGRFERHQVRGVEVIVDYAHNAAALTALLEATRAIPARRRAVVIGTAGDRNDEALRALARAAWTTVPVDLVVVKEMARFARGRGPGEVSAVLAAELTRCGAAEQAVSIVHEDHDAITHALRWSAAGDVVVVTVHGDRQAALASLGVG